MSRSLLYRLGGTVIVVIGLAIGWYGIWQPLQAAYAHAPLVQYSNKIFVVVPLCLVSGAFFLIGGGQWEYRDVERQTLTPAGWILIAAIAIVSAASFFWFDHQFSSLGYRAN